MQTADSIFNNIPSELRDVDQWVTWRDEKRKDKSAKVPYNPMSGKRASATGRKSWVSFGDAQGALVAGNCYEGIGFVLTEGDPYIVIDLDNVIDNDGNIQSWAREVVEKFSSYTEVSPSGKGLHIWFRAKKPGKRCRPIDKSLKLEIYGTARYITATGKQWPGTPNKIADRQDQINELYCRLFEVEAAKDSDTERGVRSDLPDRTDDQILEELRRAPDSHTCRMLWVGSWNGLKASQSEADLSLCYRIARHTEQRDQIDRLFRRSGLMREKWEREDYRTGTILKALEQARVHAANGVGKETVPVGPPPFPDVMSGLAGDVAALYSAHMESPPHFFYMTTLTCLGARLSGHVTLDSVLRPQPRLYVVLLGESADDRKSTAIKFMVEFFEGANVGLAISNGVGSAEGLQKALNREGNVLLVQDELKQLISKCGIQGSTLLPIISTLFEDNKVENETKDSRICVDNGHLCILAASTLDTYERAWNTSFTDIGLTNRLFLVPGRGERKYALPKTIPEVKIRELQLRLSGIINGVRDKPLLHVTPEALEKFEQWYLALQPSIHNKRLDTYGHRLMLLLAVNDEKPVVDEEIVEKVIKLLNWQFQVRCLYDPIDADNKVAKMEEKIRRYLREKGPMKERNLRQCTSADRDGIWFFRKAMENLRAVGDIIQNPKTKKWRLL